MNKKLRALIWEQTRVAGVMAMWCLLMTCLVFLVLLISDRIRWFTPKDYLGYSLLALLGALPMFLLRQDISGHLVLKFERRQARLPLSTPALVFTSLLTRCFFLGLYFSGLSLIQKMASGNGLSLNLLLLLLTAYTVLQGFVWTFNFVLYLPLLFLFGAVLAFLPVTPWLSLVLLAVSFAPALLGVHRERHREQFSPLALPWISLTIRRPLRGAFNSPLSALVWFQRGAKRFSPVLFFLLLMLFAFPLYFFLRQSFLWFTGSRRPFMGYIHGDLVRLAPYAMVVFAAAVIGLIRDFSRTLWPLSLTTFTRTKPIHVNQLAWAHLFIMTRFTFACLLGIFLLANTAYMVFYPSEAQWLFEAFQQDTDRLMPLVLVVEPLFWACLAAWLALGCMKPIALGLGTLLVVESLSFQFQNHPLILRGANDYLFLYGFCAYILVRSAILAFRAWNLSLFNGRQLALFFSAHLVLVLAAWWPGPGDRAAVLPSLFIALAFITLLLSPLVALPCQIAAKRVIN